jgi:hypothetical protein
LRVRDAEVSIYDGLCAMERFRYMRAMWIIGGELRDLYGEDSGERDRSLIADTLEVIRSVSMSENISLESSRRASSLAAKWGELVDEREDQIFPGQWNAWLVFGMLMSEIAGDSKPHLAAGRVNSALTKRFSEGRRTGRRGEGRIVGPAEEIADESPMAQVLSRVSRVVVGVAGTPESDRDPIAIRGQLAL